MSSKILRIALACFASCSLFSTVFAARFSEFAHRKGYGPNLKSRVPQQPSQPRDSDNGQSFRFLSNATQPFKVDHMPDIPFDIGEMYAGLMPIDMKDTSRALYFVFQPTVGAPVDEITIWLNGGPGCSSLEGFFQENGRFIWSWGQYAPTINPYSWVNLTNVLWVEQPVGTGFSIGNVTATSQEDIAEDFTNFFLNFEKTFGIKNFKIFVTGESYAGRYVPYISAAMLDRNDKEYFNLSGALTYDPCIGSFVYAQQQAPLFPFILANNNVMGLNASYVAQLGELDKSCGFADFRAKYLAFPPSGIQPPKYFNLSSESTDAKCDLWDKANNAALASNPCFNVYQIITSCPLPPDPLGYPTDLLFSYPGLPVYFNRSDVKQAMHAPEDVEWLECTNNPVFVGDGGPQDEGDLSADPIQSILPRVIQATNRVLISNGDLDMEILTFGTLLAIQNMTWNDRVEHPLPSQPPVFDREMFKPFKPPSLKVAPKREPIVVESSDEEDGLKHRPYKKRKLLYVDVEKVPDSPRKKASSAVNAPRKPLLPVKNPIETKKSVDDGAEGLEGYYIVLWRKFTMKKHKTWDGDGVLSVYGGYARLQDISGKEMGRSMFKDPLLPGSTLSIGGKDVEIDSSISKADFLAGRPFLKTQARRTSSLGSHSSPATALKTPLVVSKPKPLPSSKTKVDADINEIPAKSFYASSTAMKAKFKNPLLATTVMPQKKDGGATPRHDPNAPDALVMKRPKHCPKGKEIVDVVLDPFLGQHLREHQREGVKFMYECVMGMREYNGLGAILADEMGLGKTLQTIALIWTLLKQNPIHGTEGVIKKALIVCPVTLIVNWKKEFNKWLGTERIGVLVADNTQKIRLTDFTHGRSYSVMIIGYEKLRSVQEDLKKGGGIDIVIADEGHRLKTAANKSAQAIRSLNTDMRIILSGTPMQNDLSEFFEMVDFVNPGLLGKYNTFKKEFEGPIVKSRQPGALERDVEKGSARGEELASLTKMFILRRTAEILSKYLPPKTEYVLFCNPTQAQVQVYHHVLQSPIFGKVVGSSEASLQLITLLKKICNTPRLLMKKDQVIPSDSGVGQLMEVIPAELIHKAPVKSSTKFRVLDQMLKYLSKNTTEKIVIVSNYTATLDLLGQHLASLSLPFLRLDGSTPTATRQDLVDTFNRTSASRNFAFLLSAKSGGAGINLIGASRLVLFDVDWNPAVDLQAMARIHRDGQKKPVKIYRFLMAGGMDEKIYQRQVTKLGLADSVIDGKKNESSFSPEELRDLFRLEVNPGCQTHDLLGCDCKGLGADPQPPASLAEVHDIKDSEEEDSDDDLPFDPTAGIVPATKANVAAIELKISEAQEKRLKKSKGKMQALMQYRHIDTAIFKGETEDVFGFENDEFTKVKNELDDVLINILKDEGCKVGFVFAKKG
ncbi:DNA repair and recombination protein RAD54B [Lachnellula arida]|uniref:DNA repair and recombination protein RAD54B n=1 Tax=Lachnellula arida TaxID=1316785 RepID=A0A8T9BI05_9HELO|nr:DNA repair and recombination protein RAD54B [Lachnellula arida]